jgi:ketosteroid isomerase-like protein
MERRKADEGRARTMSAEDIARDLVALCRAGRFEEAGEKHWADDVVSIEPEGTMEPTHGKDEVRAKDARWAGATEVHRVAVEGPWVNGDEFVVRFTVEETVKATRRRVTVDEVGLYRVKDGKIAEERFFYAL